MQIACLPEGEIRGHAHHHSRCVETPKPLSYAKRQYHTASGEPLYRSKNLTATYLHLFFPSNPEASAALFLPRGLSYRKRSQGVQSVKTKLPDLVQE